MTITGIVSLLLLAFDSSAQTITDTIYYDNYWRICEKPIASYYRTGELQLGKRWHFLNEVKDFYTGGGPEMTGHYSLDGSKNGDFTFYHANGRLKMSGRFANDTMKGLWSYYDTTGSLYFQLTCESSRTYTPLFIKNPGGDTLLKAGTGRFAFKLLDYPDVFPGAMEHMVKGQCTEGKRTGVWAYDIFYGNDWRPVAEEVYEDGIFQSVKAFSAALGENLLQQPVLIGELRVSKLTQTEAFAHDPVFGESTPKAHSPQLVNFLLGGEVPAFSSQAKRFEANVLDYLLLCGAAIGYGRLGSPGLVWHGRPCAVAQA